MFNEILFYINEYNLFRSLLLMDYKLSDIDENNFI